MAESEKDLPRNHFDQSQTLLTYAVTFREKLDTAVVVSCSCNHRGIFKYFILMVIETFLQIFVLFLYFKILQTQGKLPAFDLVIFLVKTDSAITRRVSQVVCHTLGV